MRRSLIIFLLMTMLEGGHALAGMCSSRDGKRYCSCEFNQTCTSNETSCACMLDRDRPPASILNPLPPRSPQQPAIRTPDLQPRHEIVPAPVIPAAPKGTENNERTPAEYIDLAKSAIEAGRLAAAIDFIEKGQTRLLDRSVALNRTFDPITDEPVKQLAAAKQALQNKNRDNALKALDVAAAALH